jgi:predicted MFS family arabinose efflux permease
MSSATPATPRLGLITTVMAITCGFTVANIYYAQPLLDLIARFFHTTQGDAALVVTLTQAGYAVGLFLLVPLGDMVDARRLAAITLLTTAVALAATAFSPVFWIFLLASVVMGLTSVVVQVLIPIAAKLAPEGQSGRVVGRVMLGLLLGILLARTLSSLVAAAWGWQTIFLISAVLMVVLSFVVWRVLPRTVHPNPPTYRALISSLGRLIVAHPALRRRALSQALVFGAFSAFWTTVAFQLIDRFGLTQTGIGVFALVGAAGALAAPIAGALGDRGRGHLGSGGALLLGTLALIVAAFSTNLLVLAAAAVALDFAVQSHQVFGQHEIYALDPAARSRVNTVYMTSVFVGGAAASAIAGVLHDHGGWEAVCLFAAALPLIALGVWTAHHLRMRRVPV